MKITLRTAADAQQASKKSGPLPAGWYPAKIVGAIEKLSANDKDRIEFTVLARDADGNVRSLRDRLNDSNVLAAKLRHAAEAVGAISRFEAGEIGAFDFIGHEIRVLLSVEKRRGYPDGKNKIDDYAAATPSVIRLREGVQ